MFISSVVRGATETVWCAHGETNTFRCAGSALLAALIDVRPIHCFCSLCMHFCLLHDISARVRRRLPPEDPRLGRILSKQLQLPPLTRHERGSYYYSIRHGISMVEMCVTPNDKPAELALAFAKDVVTKFVRMDWGNWYCNCRYLV